MKDNIKTALIIVLGALAAWNAFKPWGEMAADPGQMTQVLVVRADLEPGAVIQEDLIETRVIPRIYMQQDAYEARTMADITVPVGLVTAVRIPKGDQLTRNCLKDAAKKPAAGAKANDKRSLSQEHYVEGLKYFQNANYEKARAEWTKAVKLDSKNPDAVAGLTRIKQIESAR